VKKRNRGVYQLWLKEIKKKGKTRSRRRGVNREKTLKETKLIGINRGRRADTTGGGNKES